VQVGQVAGVVRSLGLLLYYARDNRPFVLTSILGQGHLALGFTL